MSRLKYLLISNLDKLMILVVIAQVIMDSTNPQN